jgi:hypothetical protein
MLSNKLFWVGFLAAYALAIMLPPQRLLSMGKRPQG